VPGAASVAAADAELRDVHPALYRPISGLAVALPPTWT